ncbi:MAG: hypothetical protein RL220_448 [Bacteroidota bacterium]
MLSKFSTTILFALLAITSSAQEITQTIRGTIKDKVSGATLEGAIVVILDANPLIGAASDENGNFRIDDVPVGRYTIRISYTGYKEQVANGVVLNAGKELILNVALEEDITVLQQIEITSRKSKDEAINSMSTVSTRTFSVEETQKFAAAVNDPGRMASSFAGVVGTDDGNNNLTIRGNSPTGLLWRMEGTEIPNPNHFADAASSGGGISILSAQLLDNSDFMTGAFPAEYGNALSGVFDLRLRKGNNEKREYTIQAGLLGVDIAAEGPISRGSGGSYLANYRYSTLSILNHLGVNVGYGTTNFQDLSWHLHMPTKNAGTFSIYGFAGLSDQRTEAERDSSQWEASWEARDDVFYSHTGSMGIKHVYQLNDNTYLQTTLTGAGQLQGFKASELNDSYTPIEKYREEYSNGKAMLSSILNHKINSRHSLRSGIYLSRFFFELDHTYLDEDLGQWLTPLNERGHADAVQAFTQWKYRMDEDWTLNAGVHYFHWLMNGTTSVEPRVALKYEYNEKQFFTLGYGLHSQMQPLGTYFVQKTDENGIAGRPNEDLGFNQAHHIVLGYQRNLSENMYVKLETYYQDLFNIAVSPDPADPYSSLNNQMGYIKDSLVNEGAGRNYGVELTLEQFTYKGMYFLLSASLYESKYKALDGQWRDTRFNANYATTFTAGKEWNVGDSRKHKVFGLNIRTVYTGGFRYTPIDRDASVASGETVYITEQTFGLRNPDYFRTDLRFSLKRNRPNRTSTWALDLQNATNHRNIVGTYFDPNTGTVREYTNVPLIPVLSYRLEF